MSRNNPLPVSLQQECRKACKIFSSFVDPVNGLDQIIPPSILRKAKGFAFITIVKAGFVFSARAGTGVVIARLKDGTWSAPSAIGTAGVGAGFQAGAEITEFMIILNSSASVRSFMTKGSLTVGGNMSISAGPLGRNLEGTGQLSAKGGVSAMFSYSRSKGLFGGASIEGSIIVERSDANSKAYGHNVTAKQLLSGAVELPRWAEELGDTIKRRSGKDNRIPGWIEDGDEIGRRDGRDEWDEDEEEEGREVFRDDGLTPREYGEKGYSFGSQYASGGSHQTKTSGGGGRDSSNNGRRESDSPNRERSGSGTSKFGGMLGSLGASGRSRSGSSASMGTKGSSSRDGPVNGEGHNFATKFESDYDHEQTQRTTSSPLRSPPLTKKDFSLIDAQDPFSEEQNGITSSSSTPPLAATKASRPGLFSRTSSSSKLTKSRSGSGTGSALRDRVGQMNWSTFDNNNESNEDFPSSSRSRDNNPSRDSFDSLDDDNNNDNKSSSRYDRNHDDDPKTRRRASTITGSSNPSDTMSSYHRPPLTSKNSGGRSRSFTSPFAGASPFSKKKKPEFTAYNNPRQQEQQSDLYPIKSNDSFDDEPEYRSKEKKNGNGNGNGGGGGRNRGNSNPKPWDSEDENFLQDSIKPTRPSPSLSKSTGAGGGGGGSAFDFRQVEADFASVMDGKGLDSGRSRSGTVTGRDGEREDGRSRSGTVTKTSSKGAIGTAIAKYDFRGVESTDLAFSKGDVIVILNKDDEEWWRARLKLNEGMIPRNYIGEIEWY